MNDLARTNLDTLAAVRGALARYGVAAVEAAREVEVAASRTLERIAASVTERAATLAAAEQALQACARQEGADCNGPAQQVRRARERLDRARQASAAATQAVAAHTPARQRYTRQVEQLAGQGSGTLSRLSGRVEEYLSRAGGSSGGGASAGPGSAGGTGPGGGVPVGVSAIVGAPAGFALVPLALIDTSGSGVTGPESFGKGYSPADLAWAHSALHEQVLPALRAGKGADYFQARDAEADRFGSRSLADTYSGFFGDSAIKLEPQGGDGRFTVANGYHRLWVAQQMSVSHVVVKLP